MTRRQEFSAEDVRRLLHELGRRLSERGVEASVYVFGGSAVALGYSARRTTADVDALVRPATAVHEEARAMAREAGLQDGWLSSAGTAFLPNLPDGWEDEAEDFSGLRVGVADARTLIAMKMISTRSRDVKDLVVLFRAAGVRSSQEAVAIFRAVYPDGVSGREPTDEDLEIEAAEILAQVAQEEEPGPGRPEPTGAGDDR